MTQNIHGAMKRLQQYLHKTPLLTSETLNQMLGGHIYFKVESLQKTGAFKVRGVLNHLLELKEQNALPEKVVCYSTGNHGIGLSWAAKVLGIHARIYLPKYTARVKQQAAEFYGAEVIYTEDRVEAEARSKHDGQNGFYFLHPSNAETSFIGSGTLCMEAIHQMGAIPHAIFAACGGGGLLSGCVKARSEMNISSEIIATEPAIADDAYRSYKSGQIVGFTDSPLTIADGLKTLKVSPEAFAYLKQLDDFILASEDEILYWTAWLLHTLKIVAEPSCALNMVAVKQWLRENPNKTCLVLISGGNIDPVLYRQLWQEDYLLKEPWQE